MPEGFPSCYRNVTTRFMDSVLITHNVINISLSETTKLNQLFPDNRLFIAYFVHNILPLNE
jgi:hypothetical protein